MDKLHRKKAISCKKKMSGGEPIFRALRILNADFNFYKFLAVYILMTFYYFFYIFLYYMHK